MAPGALGVLRGRPGLRALAAVLGGAAMPLAFAPFGWWPLAPLGLAWLMVLLRGLTPLAATVTAYLFGLGMFGVGVGWIRESFQYNAVHGPVVYVLSAGFIAFLALFPALWAWLVARLTPRLARGVAQLLLAPAAWMLVEWLRGWLFTGFTWLQLGYAMIDTPLAGLAPLVGVYGIGWVTALAAALLAHAVGDGGGGVAPDTAASRVPAVRHALLTLASVAALLALPAALRGVSWTHALGEPFTAALVQGNYSQDRKWHPAQREATLSSYRAFTEANADARLVVWPETAVPALAQQVPDYLDALHASALARDATVLVGAPFRDPATERYHNSMLALGADTGIYHKAHLVPFGEYLPMATVLAPLLRWLRIPVPSFSPWREAQPPIGSGALRLGLSICYEAAFGAQLARAALPGATVLINVSNDAWFGDTLAPHQHLQIARMRALETGRYLLRATNTGVTAIIGPDGGVHARLPQFRSAVLRGEVQPMGGATPYVRVTDWPALLGAGLAVLLALVLALRRRG